MTAVRYLLAVDAAWNLEVRRENHVVAVRGLQRTEVPHAPGCRVPVAPGLGLPEATAEATRLARLASKLAARDYADGVVKAMGRGLFENLLGSEVWGKIIADAGTVGARRVELALAWPETEHDLHRLNWELMCDGDHFLAEGVAVASAGGVRIPLVITRVVPGAAFGGRGMSVPTRFLFAVGCSLEDPRVAPGAEYVALMRQLERMDPARLPVVRVLPNASPVRLHEAVADFRPDVVLVVAHGVQDAGEVRLEFKPDPDAAPGSHWLGAARLLEVLRRDEAGQSVLPPMVVLSACFGGAVDDFDALPMPGGAGATSHPSAPLASALVSGGVPVVIGMGGRISDRTCRLFTQFFCSSIVGGRELMDSLERGRRGVFLQGEDPTRSHDWALPMLFLAGGVAPDFRPTPPFKTGDHYELNTRLMSLGLQPQRTEPVWAARFEALESVGSGLFRDKPVLVMVGPSGSGKSRMLRELAARVVRSGDFPIHLDGRVDAEEITSAELLRKALFRAYQKAGDACGFDWSVTTQMDELRAADKPDAALKEDVRKLWRADDRELTPQVLRLALRHDLRDFAKALEAKRPGVRPVVFLGHVELLPSKFVERLLSTDLLTAFGLGTAEFPIPVVLTFDGTRLSPLLAKSLVEGREPAAWFQILTLDALGREEAVGACERVLLHPHNTTLHKAARTPWILNRGIDARTFEKRIGRLLDDSWNPALPSGFNTKDLYRWVVEAEDDGVVRSADDNDILRELEK